MELARKEQAQRFVAALAAAIVAITFILPLTMKHAPHSVRETVFRVALVPAVAAWLVVWKTPGSSRVAMFRTVMLSIAMVGIGGLTLRVISAFTSPFIQEAVESTRFVPQATAYLGIGILGVIGSFLFASDA